MRPIWNPIDDILGALGDWFTDMLRNVVSALIQGLTEAIKAVGAWFLYLPAPVLQGEGGEWTPTERVQAYTDWAVPMVGIIAMGFALVMVARRKDAESVLDIVFGLIRVVLISAAAIPGVYLLLKFSDQASPWLLQNISGGTFEEGLGQMTGIDAAAASGMAVGIMVLLIPILVVAVLGGLLNMALIMFSYGILPVVVGLLPVAAAYAMTARGRNTFAKLIGLIMAIVLFKPVAAVIYGVGIASARMITGGVGDAGQVVLQALYGCVILCAAFIALPALVRLVNPAAAAGINGGGGGALLAGAAMLATGAVTGGAAAVAGVAARGGGAAVAGAGASSGAAASGSSGLAGVSGGAGSSGAAGSAGSSGGSGSSGSSGSSGGSGSSGSSGGSGSSGASGSSGSSGGSGSSGSSGGSGSSGSSGGSGSSGASGSSGSSGAGGQSTAAASAPSTGAAGGSPRWRADGAQQQVAQQISQIDNAVERGDDR